MFTTDNGIEMRLFVIYFLSVGLLALPGYVISQESDQGAVVVSGTALSMLDEAQKKYDDGDVSSALKLLEKLLLSDKKNAPAHAKIGVIQVRVGRFHEGVEHLKRAVELSPGKIEYHRSLAQSYEFRSQHDAAIQSYRVVKELSLPGSDDYKGASKKIDFLEATKLARGGKIDKALPVFSRLVEENPDDYLIRYSLGLSYYFLRKMDLALLEFEKVVELAPAYSNAYLNMANIYESQGRVALAIESLENIIELDPTSGVSKKAKEKLGIIEGRLIAASGNHQDAVDILNSVIDGNPKSLPALMLIANSYTQLGETDFAIESYKKILILAPSHLEVKLQLAGLYMMSKRFGLAVDLLEQLVVEGKGTKYSEQAKQTLAKISGDTEVVYEQLSEEEKREVFEDFILEKIKRNPKDVESYFKLAQFYIRAKRGDEAFKAISIAAELSPSNPQINRVKAAIANDVGKLDEAIAAYSIGIMLEMDAEKTAAMVDALRLVVAKKSFSEGMLGVAEAEFKAMIADDPDNVVAYFYLGLIYAREEEFLQAVDAYENVLRMSPGNFGARLNLAGTLEKLNQEEEAISEYRKILQQKPSAEMIDNVKARLFSTEKRIKGLSASMGYAMSYDDESVAGDSLNLDGVEIRSDLSFNLSYQYKLKSGVRLRLSSTPTYSIYHRGQFDFLNASNSLSATISPGRYTIVGGYTNRSSTALLTELRSSSSDVLFSEVMTRAKFRKLYDLFSDEMIMTSFTFTFSQTSFESRTNAIFNSISRRLGSDINQNLDERTTMKLGYFYVQNDNTEIDGSDFAFRSHQLNLRLEHQFKNRVTGNMGYGYTATRYLNRDSFTNFEGYRKNATHNLSVGLAYWASRKIRLHVRYAYVRVVSNLGIRTTLTQEEFNRGLRFQSNSLTGSSRNALTTGINLLF